MNSCHAVNIDTRPLLHVIMEANQSPNIWHSQILAVAMASHSRLGATSKLQSLPSDVMRKIMDSFVRMYVVLQTNPRRLLSPNLCSPDVFWLTTFFRIQDIAMPMSHCCGRIKRAITGEREQRRDKYRIPFAGDGFFATIRENRVVVMKHAYILSNFQRYQDWYHELFSVCRRFSLRFMANDKDHNFLLFEPAFASYKTATVTYLTVDGSHRQFSHTLRRRCSALTVAYWLCDLWGSHNCRAHVRVRGMEHGLQIFVCGKEVNPDALLNSCCFNQFRKKMKRNEVLCI